MTTATQSPAAQTPQDFHSGLIVRWCPGCGDYAILAAVQKVLAERARRPTSTPSFRHRLQQPFPLYMSTYGFHSIHGGRWRWRPGSRLPIPSRRSG